MLEQAPFQLGISPVEIDYLDILFGFDLSFTGNHDEIIAESLLVDSPLGCITEEHGAKVHVVAPALDVLASLADAAPPMAGAEYLTGTALALLWQDLDTAFATEGFAWEPRP